MVPYLSVDDSPWESSKSFFFGTVIIFVHVCLLLAKAELNETRK